MKAKTSASSSDEIAIFQAYVDLINSERETLWARHNALLVANSLIIGALAISPAALWQNKWAALAMLAAGLTISGAWAGLTVLAWSAIRRHAEIAGTLASTCFERPGAKLPERSRRRMAKKRCRTLSGSRNSTAASHSSSTTSRTW